MSIKFLTWLTTYIIIILCELGDKTQLAVLLFTSNKPDKRWTIFFASALALTLCVLVEVTIGLALARHITPAVINRVAGLTSLYQLIAERKRTSASAEAVELAEQTS